MQNTKTFFTFYFDVQNNNIIVAAEINDNFGKIATKNAIVRRVMDLFETNTNINVNKADADTIKSTKKHVFNNIELTSEICLNNFIQANSSELIMVNSIKKKPTKKLYDLKAIFKNTKTKELEIKTIKIEKYTTKVKEFKENFNLSIHKDEQDYYIISDMKTGTLFVRTKRKVNIEDLLQNIINSIGIEKLLKGQKDFFNKYSYLLNSKENSSIENSNNNDICEENKENVNNKSNKSYIVGNLCFNSYKEAYDYCISSDFDPDLMIKESVDSGALKTNQLHSNKVKIKLLDKQINRLMNEYFKLKKEIDKQGIKYNDRNNILLQQLEKLNNDMDRLDSRIDELTQENRNITLNNFKLNLAALKEEYGDNKYKVINNITGAILYTNNIDNYLYNKDYSIKFMLDNKEIFKQWINKNNNGLYSNCYIVYFYKDNDTKRNIKKKELYCLDTNKQLMQEIYKSKNNINICYCKVTVNKEPLLLINGEQPTHDTLNKAIEVFKKDNDIIDILENYTIREAIKPVIKSSKDNIELMLKDYREAINKFPKLKKLYENLEYYNNLYKNNYKQLLRKFKTNIIEFTNYKINYVFYKDYLLKLDIKTKEEIKYKAPLKVVYTTHYKQYIKK